jgi:outer membrane murein-binding lipoprotein Lpp
MSEAGWTAVLAGLGALATAVIGAVAAAVVLIWNTAHRNRQESESAVVQHLNAIVAQLQQRVEHLNSHTREMVDAMAQQHEEHSQCRVTLAEWCAWGKHVHELARRLCRQAGMSPDEELPSLPPQPPRYDPAAAEHRKRTIEHHSAILQSPPPAAPSKGGQP